MGTLRPDSQPGAAVELRKPRGPIWSCGGGATGRPICDGPAVYAQLAEQGFANDDDYISFTIDVPESYQVLGFSYAWQRWAWTSENWHFQLFPDFNSWLGRWGSLSLAAGTRYVSAFIIDLTLTLQLRSVAFDAWQMRVWSTLREAAQARYEENRAMLKNELAKLQQALGAQDALSLRKVEREEVMKGVLRWLFGPTFTFVPPGLPADLYGPDNAVLDDVTWGKVLAQGEIIKFLHHAIEWENMLYFLYPYFWSHASRWEFKKYLDHPDFMHRIFLKAGAARVVMTIRPGFERAFVSFLETGRFQRAATRTSVSDHRGGNGSVRQNKLSRYPSGQSDRGRATLALAVAEEGLEGDGRDHRTVGKIQEGEWRLSHHGARPRSACKPWQCTKRGSLGNAVPVPLSR